MGKNIAPALQVIRSELIAPRMRRIVFGGAGFGQYAAKDLDYTDKYVKLAFLAEGFEYPLAPGGALDFDVIKESLPPQARPTLRTYTVRWVDVAARELAIDFVTHGDHGIAGPWADRAEPGDVIHVRGPGGGYRPKEDVDHHLLVGDESALPAIAASLEAVAPGVSATAFIEVDDADHEIELKAEADLEVRWLHRSPEPAGSTMLLDDAVRGWQWPAGRVQAFIHGESALLKSVRPYVLDGRVDRSDVSVSAYWRAGETEEGFRTWKSSQSEAIMRPAG